MPKSLATATLDRLMHHAHIGQTSGESVRLSQVLAGDGVTRSAAPDERQHRRPRQAGPRPKESVMPHC